MNDLYQCSLWKIQGRPPHLNQFFRDGSKELRQKKIMRKEVLEF